MFVPRTDLVSSIQSKIAERIGPQKYKVWFKNGTAVYGGRRPPEGQHAEYFHLQLDRTTFRRRHWNRRLRGRRPGVSAFFRGRSQAAARPQETAAELPGGVHRQEPRACGPGNSACRERRRRRERGHCAAGSTIWSSDRPTNWRWSVVRRIVDRTADYSPIFAHGGCGLGKTHLLQALANELTEKAPRGPLGVPHRRRIYQQLRAGRAVQQGRRLPAAIPAPRRSDHRRHSLPGEQEGHPGGVPAHLRRHRRAAQDGRPGLGYPSEADRPLQRAVGQSVPGGHGGSAGSPRFPDAMRDSPPPCGHRGPASDHRGRDCVHRQSHEGQRTRTGGRAAQAGDVPFGIAPADHVGLGPPGAGRSHGAYAAVAESRRDRSDGRDVLRADVGRSAHIAEDANHRPGPRSGPCTWPASIPI